MAHDRRNKLFESCNLSVIFLIIENHWYCNVHSPFQIQHCICFWPLYGCIDRTASEMTVNRMREGGWHAAKGPRPGLAGTTKPLFLGCPLYQQRWWMPQHYISVRISLILMLLSRPVPDPWSRCTPRKEKLQARMLSCLLCSRLQFALMLWILFTPTCARTAASPMQSANWQVGVYVCPQLACLSFVIRVEQSVKCRLISCIQNPASFVSCNV